MPRRYAQAARKNKQAKAKKMVKRAKTYDTAQVKAFAKAYKKTGKMPPTAARALGTTATIARTKIMREYNKMVKKK